MSALEQVHVTHESCGAPVELVANARGCGVELHRAHGTVLGTLTRVDDSSTAPVEVFDGPGGLAVIIRDENDTRYLCFPGSRVVVGGWAAELPLPKSSSSDRTPPRPVASLPARHASSDQQSVTTQAAVMAGGLATRLAPISGRHTEHCKPGVPITSRASLLRTIVEHLVETGISDIFINTHFAAPRLMAGLDGVRARLHFLHEPEPSGTAGPILEALRGAAYAALDVRKPLLVFQGDALTDISAAELLRAHERAGNPALTIAVQPVPDEEVHKFGIVETDGRGEDGQSGAVRRFIEKPRLDEAGPHRLGSTGVYVIGPALFPMVLEAEEHARRNAIASGAPGRVLDFARDVFPIALRRAVDGRPGSRSSGGMIHAVVSSGYWNDIGSPERYFQGVHDVRRGLVRLRGEPGLPDVDPSGVVYWPGARACAARTSAELMGNVIVAPAPSGELFSGST